MKIITKIKHGAFTESEALKMFLELNEGKECEIMLLSGTRTNQQNRALYKFFELLANDLNEAGLDMRLVLKQEYQIWWDKDLIKRYLWRPLQKLFFSTNSTRELPKHEHITHIHKILMRELGEKHGVEYIEFPHLKENEKDKEGRINIKI